MSAAGLLAKSKENKAKNDSDRLYRFYHKEFAINKTLGKDVLPEPCDPQARNTFQLASLSTLLCAAARSRRNEPSPHCLALPCRTRLGLSQGPAGMRVPSRVRPILEATWLLNLPSCGDVCGLLSTSWEQWQRFDQQHAGMQSSIRSTGFSGGQGWGIQGVTPLVAESLTPACPPVPCRTQSLAASAGPSCRGYRRSGSTPASPTPASMALAA